MLTTLGASILLQIRQGTVVCLVYYNISTENGNSGSPVFIGDNNYTVQGIHVAGFSENASANEQYNKGVKITPFIYSFVNFLKS